MNRPPLANGPPRRLASVRQIMAWIISCRRPTYENTQRAWKLLGYSTAAKPAAPVFWAEVDNLWNYLRTDPSWRTQRNKRCRGLILDALRALGFRNPNWSEASQTLDLLRNNGPPGVPGPAPGVLMRQDLSRTFPSWAAIAGPIATAVQERRDQSLTTDDILRPGRSMLEPHRETRQDPNNFRMLDMDALQEYFHLHGFVAREGDPERSLRMFDSKPVPKGPDNLWKAIAYYTMPQMPVVHHATAMWQYKEEKVRIWKYFTQVLRDPAHPRHREYVMLQTLSERDDADFGRLSHLRALHVNDPDAGRPAAQPDENMLYVVADYHGLQIVVLYYDAAPAANPGANPAGARLIFQDANVPGRDGDQLAPGAPETVHPLFTYRLFGHDASRRPGGHARRPVFLVTADWRHFDLAFPAREYVDPAWIFTGVGPVRCPDVPFWPGHGPPGGGGGGGAGAGAGAGAVAQNPPPAFLTPRPDLDPVFAPTQAERNLFSGHRDVAGWGFELPNPVTQGTWQGFASPAGEPVPAVFPVGDARRHQIRFGPVEPAYTSARMVEARDRIDEMEGLGQFVEADLPLVVTTLW